MTSATPEETDAPGSEAKRKTNEYEPLGTVDWRKRVAGASEFLSVVDANDSLVFSSLPEGRIQDDAEASVYALVPPAQHDELSRCLREVRTQRLPQHLECSGPGPEGETSTYSSWLFPLEAAGSSGHVGAISVDITDQRRMESALEVSESMLQAMFDQAPVYIIIANRKHLIEFMNRPPSVGYDLSDMLGKPLTDFLPEGERERAMAAVEQVFVTGQATNYEATVEGPEGRIDVSTRIGPLRRGGRVQQVMLISTDVTARRAAEELAAQLRQSQKLESVGQLAGGIAHDFNNLLTAIGGHLDLMLDDPGGVEAMQELARGAQEAVERATELTARLLVFSRKQALNPQRVGVNRLVLNVVGLLRRTVDASIQIDTELAEGLPTCVVDPTQLEAALLNLCVNARDAMAAGGRLLLRTRPGESGDNPAVAIEVSDTGTGMSPEVAERACEPFFTTKDVGQGSGLGLSMVYGFVRQSGGHLDISTRPNEGTRVTIHLPATATQVDSVPAKASSPLQGMAGNGRRVLVVEDQPHVARVVSERLKRWGYRTILAENAAAALKALRTSQFDLLFSDLGLPGGVNGCELSHKALKMQPGLAVLLTSGYSRDQVAKLGPMPAGVEMLEKPYATAQLAESIEKALGRPIR